MHIRRGVIRLLALLTLVTLGEFSVCWAQQLPRENVIEDAVNETSFRISSVFQSGMVLQRDRPVRIWGWAKPGQTVQVNFGDTVAETQTVTGGKWRVMLPPMAFSTTPRTMKVSSGDTTRTLTNILVGDVWVLGGQSNMEFELSKVENGALEIVSANFPMIRVLTVPYGQGPEERENFPRLQEWSNWFGRHFRKGYWDECTPEIARELSAIGYVFARRLHMASQVPIGVVDASRGGTTVETWTPLNDLRNLESEPTQRMLEKFDRQVEEWDAAEDLKKRIADHERWLANQKSLGNEIPPDRAAPPDDLRPGPIGDHNFPGHCFAGMIAPLRGLAVKGVIFHQGYNNAFDGSRGVAMYRDVFPEMIRTWRLALGDPKLPFCILSLCTDGYPQTRDDYCEKMFNAGIGIREAQYRTFQQLVKDRDESIGFVSTYDLRRRWYHPQLKIPAGERAARWALATQYGYEKQLEWRPPAVIGMELAENKIVLKFDAEVGDPEEGTIEGFAIAGEDRRFHPADVEYGVRGTDSRGRTQFDRRQLRLSSIMVPAPVHYRYAWGRNPLANLQKVGNRDVPVATQRSDNWRMEEVPLSVFEDGVPEELTRGDRNRIIQELRAMDQQRREATARLAGRSDQQQD